MSSFSSISLGIIIILIALLIVCFYLLKTINMMTENKIQNVERANKNTGKSALQFVYEQNGIVDCSHTRLPCVSKRQCTNNCAIAINQFDCVEGFCTASIPYRGPDSIESICDRSRGLVDAIVADDILVYNTCLSTYRDIVNDSGDLRPYICGYKDAVVSNGNLSLDLVNRPFSVEDCVCDSNYTRMYYNQTSLVRSIPVCIPNNLVSIYKNIYDII
uniref:PIF-3 n=1 Tax=Chrysodeixis chalcites nucleopolyhedrovirus TaxID=320432 RepID=T1R045_9ABAC|nr:hypothetical protein [Chrysodeixis chalcites nucleopolyhedrovirus]AGE61516.1 hypothetical protein [Chrysodeixis chalcites nucleopolyhedrovirus]